MNPSTLEKGLVKGIKKYFAEQGKKKAVVGLSGGIDSAVVLALLAKALGPKNITALLMPNPLITRHENVIDAENLANSLKVKHFIIEVDNIMHAFSALPWRQPALAHANLSPRIRAAILYNYSNSTGALVAGTGNKSEFWMGYFTKYGDAAADFFPIGSLLKTEVRQLATHMGLPREFLSKAPSAELWPGQEDEKELGIPYDVLDELLPLIISKKEKKIPREKRKYAEKILGQINATRHKREQAPVIEPLK